MAGELTASTPITCTSITAIETAIETLTLAAVTDFLFVLPVNLDRWIVFKVERAA